MGAHTLPMWPLPGASSWEGGTEERNDPGCGPEELSVGTSSGFLFISLCAIFGTVHGTQQMIFKC